MSHFGTPSSVGAGGGGEHRIRLFYYFFKGYIHLWNIGLFAIPEPKCGTILRPTLFLEHEIPNMDHCHR